MKWTLGIWDGDEGAVIATIKGDGDMYAALVGWLLDEDEQGRFWRVASANAMQGYPVPAGFDEFVTVWEIDAGPGAVAVAAPAAS